MPTITQIRDAIKAKIQTVANTGIVNRYERYAPREADFKTMFVSAGQVRGWTIRHVSQRNLRPYGGRRIIDHRWSIRAYMALDDSTESEVAFDTLMEAVIDAFDADESLGGLIDTSIDEATSEGGLQLEDSGPVMFAGVLCHGARFRFFTRNYA